jgi:hypothetical protein
MYNRVVNDSLFKDRRYGQRYFQHKSIGNNDSDTIKVPRDSLGIDTDIRY